MQRFRHILIWTTKAISAIVPICLILSYLSVYISPAKIWFFAFFGLFYPLWLIGTALIGLFWLFTHKKFSWLFFIVLIPSLFYVPAFIQICCKKSVATEAPLKIMTYNVHMFQSEGARTLTSIAKYISDENPDIVCLQELYARDTAEISRRFKQYPFRHTQYIQVSGGAFFGIGIYSHYPILETGKILFASSGNMCIYADVKTKEKNIRIYNSHLQSTYLNLRRSFSRVRHDNQRNEEIKDVSMRLKTAFIKRAEQADTLSKHIRTSPFPIINCGDHNDTPVSYTYRKMKGSLKDAFIGAGKGFSFTFSSVVALRIDYIFSDKQLRAIGYRVDDHVKLSDHYPVVAAFNIN